MGASEMSDNLNLTVGEKALLDQRITPTVPLWQFYIKRYTEREPDLFFRLWMGHMVVILDLAQ